MDNFNESLKALFVTWKVPEEFQKHCATMGCEDMDDLALLASNEDSFTDKVLTAAKITEGIDQVRSRKAWFKARAQMNNLNNPGPAVSVQAAINDDDAPLEENVVKTMKEVWHKRYGFHLSGSRILADGQFNRIYRGLNRTPRTLQVPLLESVKLLSCIDTTSDFKGLVLRDGMVKDVKGSYDMVKSLDDLYWRMQAVFSTVCYIMAKKKEPDWFGFEDVEGFMHYLRELLFKKYNGQRPSVAFFNRAYLTMMNEFCTEIRNYDVSLRDLIQGRSKWTHYWTNWTADADSERSASTPGRMDMSMLPDDLVQKVQQAWSLARSNQSRLDSDKGPRKRKQSDSDSDDGGKLSNSQKKKAKKVRAEAWKKKQGDKNKYNKGDKGKDKGGGWPSKWTVNPKDAWKKGK